METHKSTATISWEYLMPKRKERAASYIRESDITLQEGTTTMESQAKAVRQHIEKEGYQFDSQHEYKEAISAYLVPYMERPRLLDLLAAAKRKEFDVLCLNEIRALSRRQVEVFVIYDMLQKYGVRLETIAEKFEDSAIGRYILATRAMIAEVERENSYARFQRGKRDRLEIGNAPNGHPYPSYGYMFADTDREVKGKYIFDEAAAYVDETGQQWTKKDIRLWILQQVFAKQSIHSIARTLNNWGIAPPRQPRAGKLPNWTPITVYRLLTDPIVTGKVYANRYKKVGNNLKKRPQEEWVLLPDGTAPALITEEQYNQIQQQLKINKADSLRKNKHKEELGLVRAGYIYCGICERRMHVVYPDRKSAEKGITPRYSCHQSHGGKQGVRFNHRTQIHIPIIDKAVTESIRQVISHPEWVRARVAELRLQDKPKMDTTAIEATLEKIRKSLQNLYTFAENAPDDEELARISERMRELGKQKREAEAMLYQAEDEQEEQAQIEAELSKFEQWASEVRPLLTSSEYVPTYEELRLAIRILGLVVTVYPTQGERPYRYAIAVTVPQVLTKVVGNLNNGELHSVAINV